MDKIKRHKELLDRMHSIYTIKNKRYGSSSNNTFKEYGPVSYFLRMDDKFNRAKAILLNNIPAISKDEEQSQKESVYDTLIDLANYALLFVMDLEEEEESNSVIRECDKPNI